MELWLSIMATEYAQRAFNVGAMPLHKGLPYAGTFNNGVHIYCDQPVIASSLTGIVFRKGDCYGNVQPDGTVYFDMPYRLIFLYPDGQEEGYTSQA